MAEPPGNPSNRLMEVQVPLTAILTETLAMGAVNFKPESLVEPVGPLVWVLERPWVGGLALLAAGLAAAVLLRRRDQARLGFSLGAALTALAAGVVVTGTLIETDRERIEHATGAFVDAAVDGDLSALEAIVLPESVLASDGRTVAEDGLARVAELAQAQRAAGVLESYRVSRLQSTLDGPNTGTTQFRVRVTARVGGVALTWWKLHWRKDAQGTWRIATIDCLAINGDNPGVGLFEWLRSEASGRGMRRR